jgi:hypothetical protein
MTPRLSAIVVLWVLAVAIIPIQLLQRRDRPGDETSVPAEVRSPQTTAKATDAPENADTPAASLSSNEIDAAALNAALESRSAAARRGASPAHSAHPQTQP